MRSKNKVNEQKSIDINKQIEEFFAKGNEIEEVPSYSTSAAFDKREKDMRNAAKFGGKASAIARRKVNV